MSQHTSRTAIVQAQLSAIWIRLHVRLWQCVIGITVLLITVTVGVLISGAKSNDRTERNHERALPASGVARVYAAGRGKPLFNFRDGREMSLTFRGKSEASQALQSGEATPRALASADFDGNATPDVVAGYAFDGAGIVTLQRGNPDAYAPQDQSVYERMQSGYNPDALLPTVETFEVPAPADFVQIGDFNGDGRKDILVGARHGVLMLLKADESSGFLPAEPVQLPGQLTSLTAGEFRAPDGKVDVAVGINGPGGPQLLIYDGVTGGLTGTPMEFLLSSEASVIRFDTMDADSFVDAVVAAGSEIRIVHGWGRKQSPALDSRLERVSAGSEIRGLSTGHFIWDREGRREIAVLTEDGTFELIQAKGLNTTKFTEAELATRNRERFRPQITQQAREQDVEAAPAWNSRGKSSWAAARTLATNAVATGLSSLATTNMNSSETDEVVITTSKSELKIVRQTNGIKMSESPTLALSGDVAQLSLTSEAPSVAALQLPAKLNGERNMLVLQEGASAVTIVPLAPATITVDRFDDPDAGAPLQAADNCTAAASDCSLRGAIEFANAALAADQPTTINLPAGTYTLDNNGTAVAGCDNNPVGDLTINGSIAMVGLGGGAIIQQLATGVANDGDRAMCLNLAFAINKTYSFSNLTIIGGRDGSSPAAANVLGGGGIIGGELDNLVTLTNVTLANNQVLGATMGTNNNGGGGGIQITGGDLTITNCTIGGTSAPGTYADRTNTTTANLQTGSGGGLAFTPSSPMHMGGTGDLMVTGTTFNRNTASGIGGGGADLFIFAFASPGGIGSGTASVGTSTFSNNQGLGTANGGGIIVESLPTTINSSTNFNTNSAGNRGGGIYVGGGSLLLNGAALPAITFSGNTATSGGSSISTTGPVSVAGTNTTIGGDIEINTGGTWTNNAGSALSPTNVLVNGGTFTMNNSTMNVSGNLTIQSAPLFVGTFNGGTGTVNIQGNFSFTAGGPAPGTTLNAGTGTFNFNGTGSQSISNTASITFFNLTDSNVTQPLTLNNSLGVNGTLNVNGANATLAPVAATVISGTGTLTGIGTARVTRTGANAFLSQYTMTNKTLTNLTVEYVGAAAQGLSVTTYGPLKINNGNGVSLESGTATVNGLLTLTAGAFNVGAAPRVLVINNGTSVGAGSITSGADGTVNYNQGTAGQAVLAFNYGNLTFSNQNKVLAGIGTIGVAGIFTPGTAVGHTIAGSTINFNGTGAQTIPAFNYFNLSTSGARGANNLTFVNGGTIGIAGAFSPGATFAGGANIVTNNTIDYNGSGAQIIAAFNYNNLTSSNSGARTLQNGGTIGIAGVFTPGSNVYAVANSTVNFNGTGAQTIPAFNYFNLMTAGARGANNITLANGGTIGIAGTFNPTASFAGGNYVTTNNIVDYNGTGAQTIAAFNYNNLNISQARGANNITLVNGGTIGIANIFNPTATFTSGSYVITNNTINFNGAGAQTISAFNYFNLTSSGGAAARTLANSGNIGIAGVFTPGTNVYTITGSTIVYNGTAVQTMPNSFLTYNNLTLSNPAGVTGFAGTINVSGNWTNTSVAGFSANGSTVNFNGSAAQVIGGTNATTFNNLTIANAGSGVSLGQNINVNGVLTLTNDLTTGANILTMPATASSAGGADVIGNVRRTGFTGGGPALSYGNPFNSIAFAVGGTLPTDVTINLVKAVPSGGIAFPTAVQRTYTITPTGGAGFSATLRLHYLDAELNGNVETDLGLWRFGAAWARQGRTGAVNIANNWVELLGVTQFSPWTFSSAKNDTTTTITSDTPDPSTVNQSVPINYTVVSNVAGAPSVTGNVTITVNDASGDTCTGSVAAGTCNLTLTTLGSKTLTATYSSDVNFNGSSDTEAHEVVPVNVNIKDAKVAEPASGTADMIFSVTLSAPATVAGSVNFQTADGTATAGTCGSGGDYETTSGTVNFAAGQQVQTINVPVCADALPEADETFLVNLSSPTNLTLVDGQATGTITANTPGTVLISELRTSGPSGAGDDFLELYNNSNSPLTVTASDASGGYGLYKAGATAGDAPIRIATIANGTVIPARGHYLLVGSAYSLANYGGAGLAAGNLTLTADIESDRNVALFNTADVTNVSTITRLDAVGFASNAGGNFDLLREGTNLPAAGGSTAQYSFVRLMTTGLPQDLNNNLGDFVIVATDPSLPIGSNPLPILGAPGPENATNPIQRNATVKASLIDPAVSSNASPNRVRDTTSYTDALTPSSPGGVGGPYTLGTLLIRRKFTNNTGGAVTRLRFRVVDITTTNTPGGPQADLRALTSATQPSVTITGGGTVAVQGLTLEQVPTQLRGGGLNPTLSAGTITLGTPLANGANINVNFLLGVATGGSFRFFINVEALP